uniref:C-type lectin domain-containing protein n=1 Tax=Sinocyclocheilus rhinocerous TaxID=307959 RepID=A0A673GUJ6_9TELE
PEVCVHSSLLCSRCPPHLQGRALSACGFLQQSNSSLALVVNGVKSEGSSSIGRRCTKGWEKLGTQCFKYFSDLKPWAEAEKQCLNLGGNLVSVHSQLAHNFLKTLVKKHGSDNSRTWIGAHDAIKVRNAGMTHTATLFSISSVAEQLEITPNPNFVKPISRLSITDLYSLQIADCNRHALILNFNADLCKNRNKTKLQMFVAMNHFYFSPIIM